MNFPTDPALIKADEENDNDRSPKCNEKYIVGFPQLSDIYHINAHIHPSLRSFANKNVGEGDDLMISPVGVTIWLNPSLYHFVIHYLVVRKRT